MEHSTSHDYHAYLYTLETDLYTLQKIRDALYTAIIEKPRSAMDLQVENLKVQQFNGLIYDQIEFICANISICQILLQQSCFAAYDHSITAEMKSVSEQTALQICKELCKLLTDKIQNRIDQPASILQCKNMKHFWEKFERHKTNTSILLNQMENP